MPPTVRDPSDAEDIQKVQAYLAGDSTAFEFLFDKYRERVFRIAFRFVRNKEDALDVAQEVFLRVAGSLSSFKTDSKFFTWLYRISVNRSIDFTRHKKSHPMQAMEPEMLDSRPRSTPNREHERSPHELAETKDLETLVSRAVSKLSEKHKAVFLLHATENLSYKEIATVMDCSIGTVMSRLFYARKKLQELLGTGTIAAPGRHRSADETVGESTQL